MILLAFFAFWGFAFWCVYFYLFYRQRSAKDLVVLITGGGSGIGRLMAHRFASKGARIVLWDVNRDGLAKVCAEITTMGAQCTTNFVDVADRELVYRVAKEVGPVDILINNAGIVTGKHLLECPDELMVKTMQVNTISHFWTIKAFLPAMMERNDGHIVTIASAAGLSGVAGLVDYCASKFGAVGIAEAVMMEMRRLKKKVRTTLVCPYYINTGMFDGVKTKFPSVLPILDENWAADRIVKGILRGEESICMPWFVNVTFVAKILPVPWQAWIAETLGVSDSMDDFKGRGQASPVALPPSTTKKKE